MSDVQLTSQTLQNNVTTIGAKLTVSNCFDTQIDRLNSQKLIANASAVHVLIDGGQNIRLFDLRFADTLIDQELLDLDASTQVIGGAILLRDTKQVSIDQLQSREHTYNGLPTNDLNPLLQRGIFGLALWNVQDAQLKEIELANLMVNGGDFSSAFLIEAGCTNVQVYGLVIDNAQNSSDVSDLMARSDGLGIGVLTNIDPFAKSTNLKFDNVKISNCKAGVDVSRADGLELKEIQINECDTNIVKNKNATNVIVL